MVFQSYALFPHLTVAENIMFGLKARGVPKRERARRLDTAVEMLGHRASCWRRKPGQLSGGQQQRVALGRAIVAEAPVCLMDEPLSNLDAQLRADMRREIRRLQRRLGITMIYVTHDQTEAMGMADQVVLLRDGRIEQDGRPPRSTTRPATPVRRPLHRHAADEPARSMTAARRWWSPAPRARRCSRPPGVAAMLGLRPEDVRWTPAAGHGRFT